MIRHLQTLGITAVSFILEALLALDTDQARLFVDALQARSDLDDRQLLEAEEFLFVFGLPAAGDDVVAEAELLQRGWPSPPTDFIAA